MSNAQTWMNVHGVLKNMMYSLLTGIVTTSLYVLKFNEIKVISQKSEIRSLVLRRLWACWDLTFERWTKDCQLPNYREQEIYKLANQLKNIIITIVDNDGAYLKLINYFLIAWEEVKEDDKWLKDTVQ